MIMILLIVAGVAFGLSIVMIIALVIVVLDNEEAVKKINNRLDNIERMLYTRVP